MPTVPKKRGRRPKVVEEIKVKSPRKRGRKCISEIYEKKTLDNVSLKDEAIILCLPISINEYLKNYANQSNEYRILNDKSNKELDYYNVISGKYSLPSTESSSFYKCKESPDIVDTMGTNGMKSGTGGQIYEVRIYDINFIPKVLSSENLESVQELKTDISCWWCCHRFTSFPVSLPVKYNMKTCQFHVYGCFCSFNCVAAYIYEHERDKSNHLLHFMYRKLTKIKIYRGSIKRAGPRESLKMFGGPLSITEFRENFNSLDELHLNIFPVCYISRQLEEHRISKPLKKGSVILPEETIRKACERVGVKKTLAKVSNNLTSIMGIKSITRESAK